MLPTVTDPKLIPMPIAMAGSPSRSNSRLSPSSPSSIATAHFTASPQGSGDLRGAPKSTIMPSPMNLSTVPSNWCTARTMLSKYRCSTLVMTSGGIFSVRVVKPRMSLNRMHTSASCPPTPGVSPPTSISFITAGLTCPAKDRFRRMLSMPSAAERATKAVQRANDTDASGSSAWCSRIA
jgi:hypothetical protein